MALSDPPHCSLSYSAMWWPLVLVDLDGPGQEKDQRGQEMKKDGKKVRSEGGVWVAVVVAELSIEEVARDLATSAAKTGEEVNRRTDHAR